jgi:flavin-dependent dehydrogenase
VGDAAGLVNPTTGGGIGGAAYSGQYAGQQAVEAIETGDVSERQLWAYNKHVMDDFGARFATLDVYNIFSTAYDLDDLMGMIAALPAEKIAEGLYSGETDIGLWLKVKTAVKAIGHLGTIYDLYETKQAAERILDHYETYPETREAFDRWQTQRDSLMDDVYATTGADAKY